MLYNMMIGTLIDFSLQYFSVSHLLSAEEVDDKGAASNVAAESGDVKESNNQTNQAPHAFDVSTNESNLNNYRYLVWSAGDEEDRFILFARSADGGKTITSPIRLICNIRSEVFNTEIYTS